jgi:hypothetical protein
MRDGGLSPLRGGPSLTKEVKESTRQFVGGLFLYVMTGVEGLAGHAGSPGAPDAEHVVVVKLGEVVFTRPER